MYWDHDNDTWWGPIAEEENHKLDRTGYKTLRQEERFWMDKRQKRMFGGGRNAPSICLMKFSTEEWAEVKGMCEVFEPGYHFADNVYRFLREFDAVPRR